MSPAAGTLDPDELAHLEEQRDFLLRSLEDLEREHDAGDLDDTDYEHLSDDYTARAAETLRAIKERRAAFESAKRPPNPRRTLVAGSAVLVFAVAAGIAVAASVGARQPGGVSSGGITVEQTDTQKAGACEAKMPTDPAPSVVACFRAILDRDQHNVVALTWLGWELRLSAGTGPTASVLMNAAADLEAKAVAADPSYSFAHAFRAIIAYERGDAAAAKKYLADFRSHDPSAEAQSIIQQEGLDAKIAQLAAATGSSTTTTTTTTSPH